LGVLGVLFEGLSPPKLPVATGLNHCRMVHDENFAAQSIVVHGAPKLEASVQLGL